MRILQANKFFYNSGGADKVFFDTISGLKKRDHEVIEFSMHSNKNSYSKYDKYFVSEIPARLTDSFGLVKSLKITKRFFYSREVKQKLSKLIHDTKPEVAHLHNVYHHLSASIFTTLFKHHIPTVLTLHDYFPLCPNHNFAYKNTFNKEKYKKSLYTCIQNKCINNKLAPSIVGTFEAYYYRLKKIWEKIDYFICPSEFMKQTMLEWGFEGKKMRVVFNPFTQAAQKFPLGTKVVYIGRLHFEKGLKYLLEAAQNLSQYEFIIAGSGPYEKEIDKYIKINKIKNITRYGWVQAEMWIEVMKQAKTVVVPSIFYENCSMQILEDFAFGRIVVASNRGGNPEMIHDGRSGFLCKAEDAQSLTKKIVEAMELSSVNVQKINSYTEKEILPRYDFENYITNVEDVYTKLV